MGISLPIIYNTRLFDRTGRSYLVDIQILQSDDFTKYRPDGVKCVFRVLREMAFNKNKFELVLLVDNHDPFGFHSHPDLPEVHEKRVELDVRNWKEAWILFDIMVKELINEA
jgi:hypothetical protein